MRSGMLAAGLGCVVLSGWATAAGRPGTGAGLAAVGAGLLLLSLPGRRAAVSGRAPCGCRTARLGRSWPRRAAHVHAARRQAGAQVDDAGVYR